MLASSVTGQPLGILGSVAALVHVGDTIFSHTFHITRTATHPVLIGWDFMVQHAVTVDILCKQIRLYDTATSLSPPQSFTPLHSAAITVTQVTDPSISEMTISVSIRDGVVANPFTDSFVGIVEAQSPQAASLGSARTLTTIQNGKGIVRVVNPTGQPVSLGAGCPVGQFFSITGKTQDEYALVSAVNTSAANTHAVQNMLLADTCLNSDQTLSLKDLLAEFSDIFSSHPHDYGKTDLLTHSINTGNAAPIKLRPYRTSPAMQNILQQEVSRLLERDVIEESQSPWSAPVVLV